MQENQKKIEEQQRKMVRSPLGVNELTTVKTFPFVIRLRSASK